MLNAVRNFGCFRKSSLLCRHNSDIITTKMIDSIIFSKTKGTMEVSVSVYVFKENDVYVA